jgi:tryptophan synthase alpha chain
MSRLAARFAQLKQQGRVALIPYITAGDPQPAVTVPLMHALVVAGADVLELGVPFSDPMADGPVIQQAAERALKHHVSLHHVLDMVREFRKKDSSTPVVLMGYLNPIEVFGYPAFAKAAAAAGVDGALTVDLPPEEADDFVTATRAHNLDTIFLLAPTSDAGRIQRILGVASGFVYYVSLRGVTGAGHLDLTEVRNKVSIIKKQTTLPVGVGFGIGSPEAAAQVAAFADAVVVGSALVQRVAALAATPDKIPAEAAAFIGSLRAAIDRVPTAKQSGGLR